jgi:hypothetical protein
MQKDKRLLQRRTISKNVPFSSAVRFPKRDAKYVQEAVESSIFPDIAGKSVSRQMRLSMRPMLVVVDVIKV